jgi:prepilin-type N-terminal cleavage/methylation domain-containing protein
LADSSDGKEQTTKIYFTGENKMYCKKKGVTLIELLIVILILGALAAIAVPRISQSADSAKVNACATNIKTLNTQIELYASNHSGTYPATLAVLTGDPNYFPDGALVCTKGGTYSKNASNRAACNHT